MNIEKPNCQLSGEDGNVFSIIGRVAKTLKRAGLREQMKEFENKAWEQDSYGDVLLLCSKYVNVLWNKKEISAYNLYYTHLTKVFFTNLFVTQL